jgi:hypothetical protein
VPGAPGGDDHGATVDRAASLTARLHRFNDVEIRGKLIVLFFGSCLDPDKSAPKTAMTPTANRARSSGSIAKRRIERVKLRGAVVGSLGTWFTIWDAMVRTVAIASPLDTSSARSRPPCNRTSELARGR